MILNTTVLLSLDRSNAMVGLAAEDLNKNGAIYYLLTPPHTEAAKDLKKTKKRHTKSLKRQKHQMKSINDGAMGYPITPSHTEPANDLKKDRKKEYKIMR